VYCLDTSALVGAWVRSYPPDVFPALWQNLDELIGLGHAVAPEEVMNELEAKEDALFAWVKQRRDHLFVGLDEAQMVATTEILDAFPRLVGELADRNRADPFVIALARVRGLVVVSEERGGTVERPRIPLVCDHFGVRTMSPLAWIRELRWIF
jgi:hypothetical protein